MSASSSTSVTISREIDSKNSLPIAESSIADGGLSLSSSFISSSSSSSSAKAATRSVQSEKARKRDDLRKLFKKIEQRKRRRQQERARKLQEMRCQQEKARKLQEMRCQQEKARKIQEMRCQIAIEEKRQQLAIEEKRQQLAIEEKRRQFPIEEKRQQLAIAEKLWQLATAPHDEKWISDPDVRQLRLAHFKSPNSSLGVFPCLRSLSLSGNTRVSSFDFSAYQGLETLTLGSVELFNNIRACCTGPVPPNLKIFIVKDTA